MLQFHLYLKLNSGFNVFSMCLVLTFNLSGNVILQYGSDDIPSSGFNPNATGIIKYNYPFMGFLLSNFYSLSNSSKSSVNGSGTSLFYIPYWQYIIYK